jgi:hypothetical protein
MKLTHLSALVAFALATPAMPLHAEPEPASATSVDAASARHAQDLRELMVAVRIFKYLQREPTNWATMTAPDHEFSNAFRRQVTEEEAYRRLTPGYAALISAKQAAELARLTRSPAWRKREQRLQELNGASVYLSTFMTPAEIAETRRIDSMPAMLALQASRKNLHQKNQEMINRWTRQFDDELHVQLVNVLRKVKSDMAANREARIGGTVTIGRVGVPYADKYAYIAGSAIIKMENAYNRFDDTLKNLGFADILKSEYLASKLSLAHSRTVVEEAEAALETLLKNVDLAIKEREEEMRKLALPQQAESSRTIEGATGIAYGYMVDFGEGYRRLLDDHRRLLAFVAERSGKVKYDDGKLLFSSDADLALARDLFNKLDATRAELIALVERQTKKEIDDERRQRGGRVMPAPTDQS